jgi:hypothetical protein
VERKLRFTQELLDIIGQLKAGTRASKKNSDLENILVYQ